MAGATHGLIRLLADDSGEGSARAAARTYTPEAEDAPPRDAPPPQVPIAAITPREPVLRPEPAPAVPPSLIAAPGPQSEPEPAGALEPAAPAPAAQRAPVAQRALVARVEPAPPVVRTERRAPEPPAPPAPVKEPAPRQSELREPPVRREPPSDPAPATSLPSCESAAASANQSLDLGAARGAPDLTREALAAVLENGAYLAGCGIPARTTLDICAAVQDGKVVGVSAVTEPQSAAVNACVRRAVASLRFPHSARLDVTRTRFQATR
jgi:hypothetical protein